MLPAGLGLFAVVGETLDLFGMPAAKVELVASVDLATTEISVGQDSRAELAGLHAGDDLVLEGGGGDHFLALLSVCLPLSMLRTTTFVGGRLSVL